jgi:hypothetical protein
MTKKKANLGTEFQEVPFETKKEIILAIANPDKSIDDIIKEHFKSDITDKEREQIAQAIQMMRDEHGERLKAVFDHTDENGNYKPTPKEEDGPVLTMELADTIEKESNKILETLIEGGPIPREVILTIAIVALAKYTGKPVSIKVDDDED